MHQVIPHVIASIKYIITLVVKTLLVEIYKILFFKTFSLHQNDAHKLSDASQKICW